MNILVTGACGQLGNEMQLQAQQHPGHQWFFTDVVSVDSGIPAVTSLDITDRDAIEPFVADNAIDIIVNCAAFTAVDRAESEPERALLLNATAPGYLAAAIKQRGGQLIQISTDYVFDGTAHTPYTEESLTCPASVYGRTKLAGEEAVMSANASAMIIRTAWLYSRFGNNFVKTMLRLGREKSELGVISWYDFTKAIHRLAGITTCKVRPLHTAEYPTPATRPHYSVLDKTKIKQTYSIEVPYWLDSLEACIKELS